MSTSSIIGRTLGGKYLIKQLVGRGGMATVYRGYQADVERDVAVKVLPTSPALGDEFVERFRLEARTIARLQHPHILPLYDYGVEDGILYLVTAYIGGGTLSDRIARGPLPLGEVNTLLRQIAPALDYAHRQGVIHRDIKPANILISTEGYPLLADFGIAKLVEGDSGLTATGGVIGTPAYIAPEQVQGLPVGPSADIYSLGVVVFEMLAGRQPYQAETPMQVLVKHMAEPVPPLSAAVAGLPPALDAVLARALAKNVELRYPTAAAFAADYGRVAQEAADTVGMPQPPAAGTASTVRLPDTPAGAPVPPPTPPPTQPQPAAGGTPPALLLGGLGVIAALVLVIVVLVLTTLNRGGPTVVSDSPTATDAASAALPTAQPAPPTAPAAALARPLGRLTFSTANQIGDTANLRLERLAPTAPGMSYAVWLLNSETGDRLGLGALTVDPTGSGVLSYTDPEGRPLPTLFNSVAITREELLEDAPTGAPTYGGRVPIELTRALRAILVSAAGDANGGGLLAGALSEGEIAALHAGLAAEAGNAAGMHTHAEHTVNALLGTQDDLDNNGRGENPGRSKLGIPHFLDLITARLDEALDSRGADRPPADGQNQPGERLAALFGIEPDMRRLQGDAEVIRVCLNNAYTRTEQTVELERALLAATSVEAVTAQAGEARQTADRLINGFDLNGNGQIEAFEGECGLRQIPVLSVIMGSIDIFPLEAVAP
ncbi:MAG: hypothetical protein BroJett033_0060 [Chloroflexota bacterium]|nr:MAG: hypothetical protein BroJett033_0060 [Chloroflexota bacterium]